MPARPFLRAWILVLMLGEVNVQATFLFLRHFTRITQVHFVIILKCHLWTIVLLYRSLCVVVKIVDEEQWPWISFNRGGQNSSTINCAYHTFSIDERDVAKYRSTDFIRIRLHTTGRGCLNRHHLKGWCLKGGWCCRCCTLHIYNRYAACPWRLVHQLYSPEDARLGTSSLTPVNDLVVDCSTYGCTVDAGCSVME
jgi:hypothetical protein